MASRAAHYGLERDAMRACRHLQVEDRPREDEVRLSMAISLKRLADRLDDLASGNATINADVRVNQ